MNFKKFLFISFAAIIFSPLFVLADSNNITSLVFTTDPQTVAVDTLSAAFTVQTVNAAGTSEKVSETNDVTFTTTSSSGQFLNSSGSAVSTTMNSNTSSRTFYYKDSTAGNYTITVSIKGRTSGKQFSATQTVTIGGGSGSSNAYSTSSTSSNSSGQASSPQADSNNSNSANAAYSSQVEVYYGIASEPFQVSVGRDRLATVGAPISFMAKLIPRGTPTSGLSFRWSFGDGASWNGLGASHIYMYPGNYVVVLNVSGGGNEAVDEAKVKVVSAEVTISASPLGFLEVKNNSSVELNLGGWKIVSGPEKFILPQDTIIGAKSTVKIPMAVLSFKDFLGSVDIYNPSAVKMASTIASNQNVQTDMTIALPDGMTQAQFSEKFSAAFESANRQEPKKVETMAVISSSASTSAAAVIYSVPQISNTSIFSRIGSWFGILFKR